MTPPVVPPPPSPDDHRNPDGSIDWRAFRAAASEWAESVGPVTETPPTDAGGES